MKLLRVPLEWTDSILYIDPSKIVAAEFCFDSQCWLEIIGVNKPLKLNCTAAEFVAWLNGGAA